MNRYIINATICMGPVKHVKTFSLRAPDEQAARRELMAMIEDDFPASRVHIDSLRRWPVPVDSGERSYKDVLGALLLVALVVVLYFLAASFP